MKKLALFTLATILILGNALAQTNGSHKKTKKETDTKIRIKTKDGEIDLEKHMENLGEDIGSSIEKFFESFEMKWNDGALNVSFSRMGIGKVLESALRSR